MVWWTECIATETALGHHIGVHSLWINTEGRYPLAYDVTLKFCLCEHCSYLKLVLQIALKNKKDKTQVL